MLFAAIDIGSNGVRLLFSIVFENGRDASFKKTSLIRVPLRLGADAFVQHRISDENVQALIETMKGFRHLINVMKPVDYIACATSAMREAENGREIVEEVSRLTGISIEIINGEQEAEIIYSNHAAELIDPTKHYLYIDVGGGSTELTLFANNKRAASRSFNIGTVRILQDLVDEAEWTKLNKWLKNLSMEYSPILGIGTGGNINTIFKLSRKKNEKPLTLKFMKKMHKYLNSYSYDERVKILGLKPDRADVIIPATDIFLNVMSWGKIQKLHVPIIGLLDGIIHTLYEKYKNGQG